ncbi:hypothetical protein [Anoxynatronum sibiricum]|uniref:Transcriptional regulator n=1 Tax=Anoxynatronum sibiricum TaxID=210623 RepID=A0ABU9VX77_9CLOT
MKEIMTSKTEKPQNIRENNQKVLAHYLYKNGPTSRAKLSSVFNLSLPSVYKNINQLVEQNVVLELGEGDSEGGRKPMLVGFNYNMGYMVSVDLKGEHLKIALANLALDIIGKEEMFTLNYENSLALFDAIIESIKNLLNQNEIHHHYLK